MDAMVHPKASPSLTRGAESSNGSRQHKSGNNPSQGAARQIAPQQHPSAGLEPWKEDTRPILQERQQKEYFEKRLLLLKK